MAVRDRGFLEQRGLAGIKIAALEKGDKSNHFESIRDAWAADSDDTAERCKKIKETYLKKHSDRESENVAYIVLSHAPVIAELVNKTFGNTDADNR